MKQDQSIKTSKKTLLAPHFLTGEELSQEELKKVLDLAQNLSEERLNNIQRTDLQGKHVVMLFDKPSLRTRLSFTVAVNELGGHVIESLYSTRKSEDPEDVARVLSGYCHGLVIRTHDHNYIERMAKMSPIPVINGLTDSHHPCQVIADLLTLRQKFDYLSGLTLTYIGDGNNMLHSLLLLCPYLGLHVRYSCPSGYEPNAFIVKKAQARALEGGGSISEFSTPEEACEKANALYTDVWTSMGFENESLNRDAAFGCYQLNEGLLNLADKKAVVMHCMPMIKGKEISKSLPEHAQSVIFQQSANRLPAQKAILLKLMNSAAK